MGNDESPLYLVATPRRHLLMIEKRLLVTDCVRRPPREGFSWVDRRFLREYAARLPGDAILLYFFLTAVSDQQGLSFTTTPRSPCVCGCARNR
jgi:hypothetical protein